MAKFSHFVETQTCSYKFSHFQIAQNGIWEDALQISPSPNEQELNNLEKFIIDADQDLAIEAFFRQSKDDFLFFGIRIESLEKCRQISFVRSFIDCAKEKIAFSDFISCLQKDSFFNFFENSPDFLEIGAEGFWKSYGSLVVKKKREQALSLLEIEQKAPQLLEPFSHQMMLEHAYNSPMPHWLALPLSKKQSDAFILDKDRYKIIIDMLEKAASSC